MTFLRAFCILSLGMLAGGCDIVGGTESGPQYVVEGYLVAGGAWGAIRLSRTAAVQDTFSFRELAVSGAAVRVDKLDADGNVTATVPYGSTLPGIYRPSSSHGSTVEPLATYRLRVEVPPGEGGPRVITATTTVPDTFRVVRAPADTVTYQGEGRLQLTITRSHFPGRESKFVFSTEAKGRLQQGRLTPLLRQFLCDNEELPDLNDIRQNTSPVLSEANYQPNPDGTLTISVPWLVFSFYRENRLNARALDDNMYDYLRSYSAQQGSPTLAPGELPNVIDHVEGGTGLWGSYARVSSQTFLRRPPSDTLSTGCENRPPTS